MTSRMLAVVSIAVGLIVASAPASAHHSASAYDSKQTVTLTGTVTQYEFINPHIIIHFSGKDAAGDVAEWSVIGGPPSKLARDKKLGAYWNRDTFKPGEQLTISGNPYRDGRKIMNVTKIVRANGEDVPLGNNDDN